MRSSRTWDAMNAHTFSVHVMWTGDRGSGTSDYQAYGRDHEITAALKTSTTAGSAAKAYRGDATRYNPEELLIAALSACHMLWYLHLCADAGIAVRGYDDAADCDLQLDADGSGSLSQRRCFRSCVLKISRAAKKPCSCTRKPTPGASSHAR